MNEQGPHRLLKERVAALETIIAGGGLIDTMRNVALLLELVGDLTNRVAALDGGPGIDEAYAKKVAKRAVGGFPVPPERGGAH
jgi:hypothetical protein